MCQIQKDRHGQLRTSLPTDIGSILSVVNETLETHLHDNNGLELTERGYQILVQTLLGIVEALRQTQRANLLAFGTTWQSCAAAANDFHQLADFISNQWMENQVYAQYTILQRRDTQGSLSRRLRHIIHELTIDYSQDSVAMAERCVVFGMKQINHSAKLFGRKWEQDYTDNQVTKQILTNVDDFLQTTWEYLGRNEFLCDKLVLETCRGVVGYYVQALVERADAVRKRGGIGRRQRQGPFQSLKQALRRMEDDIELLSEYFLNHVQRSLALERSIAGHIYILELLHECLATERDDLETYIVVIHKHTGADALVTNCLVRDLQLLAGANNSDRVRDCLQVVEPDLTMVSNHATTTSKQVVSELVYTNLPEMLRFMYEDRLARGMLPLCWTCIPKNEENGVVVTAPIRAFSRSVAEIRKGNPCPNRMDCI